MYPGVAHDSGLEVTRHEVDPALVDEEAVVHRDATVAAQPFGPPRQECVGLVRHRDEAEIEDAGESDFAFAGEQAVAGIGLGRVGREDDRVSAREIGDVGERREDLDVGIEIAGGVVVFEEVLQQPRLHRGRELEDGVDHRHVVKVAALDVEVVGADDVEELAVVVDLAALVVEHEHRERGVRITALQRRGEHACVGQIVARSLCKTSLFGSRLRVHSNGLSERERRMLDPPDPPVDP